MNLRAIIQSETTHIYGSPVATLSGKLAELSLVYLQAFVERKLRICEAVTAAKVFIFMNKEFKKFSCFRLILI